MWDVGKCHQDKYLSSTEVYRGGRWVTVGPLPMAVDGVRGVTLDNTVFMTGQWVFYLHTHIVQRISTLQVARTISPTTGQRSGDTMQRAAPGY